MDIESVLVVVSIVVKYAGIKLKPDAYTVQVVLKMRNLFTKQYMIGLVNSNVLIGHVIVLI